MLASGERVGTVVEWLDRTAEVSVESELQQVLAGVLAGDLGKRISTAGRTGFFETMCRGVNQLADNMSDIVSKVKAAADEVHRGAEEMTRETCTFPNAPSNRLRRWRRPLRRWRR